MRYLCLIYGDPEEWERGLPNGEAEMISDHFAFDESLRKSGHLIFSDSLQDSSTATVVRMRNGRISRTDGPFVETKEQLGGLYLIEAKDLDEALQIAGRIPSARLGSIEVRPVRYLTLD